MSTAQVLVPLPNTRQVPTALPNAYNAPEIVHWLITQQWGLIVNPSDYVLPSLLLQGTDYGGHDNDSRACNEAFFTVAGRPVPTWTISVRPFQANDLGAGVLDRLDLASLSNSQDGLPPLAILNSAPGRNVGNGTQNNVRERFFGAKLKNGAIVVGTFSDDIPHLVAQAAETIVEISLWNSGSQARGIHVFQTIAYAFYQVASKEGWRGEGFRPITGIPGFQVDQTVKRKPNPEIVFEDFQSTPRDGVSRYIITDDIRRPRWDGASIIFNEPRNALGAGYRAFQLANGGQTQRELSDPVRPQSIIVIEQRGRFRTGELEVWAQLQPNGKLVVGVADPDLWRFSHASTHVHKTPFKVKPGESLQKIAEKIWADRYSLYKHPIVSRDSIALANKPQLINFDPFGNGNAFFPDIAKAKAVVITHRETGVTATFPTKRTLFETVTADLNHPELFDRSKGVTEWASGGGHLVYVQGVGPVPLQVSQITLRTASPDLRSAAHVLGLRSVGEGLRSVGEGLRSVGEGVFEFDPHQYDVQIDFGISQGAGLGHGAGLSLGPAVNALTA